jgi:hypothetical protein
MMVVVDFRYMHIASNANMPTNTCIHAFIHSFVHSLLVSFFNSSNSSTAGISEVVFCYFCPFSPKIIVFPSELAMFFLHYIYQCMHSEVLLLICVVCCCTW